MTAEPSRKDFALHRGFAPPSPKGITHGLDSPARLLPVLLAVPPAPGPTPGRRRFAAGARQRAEVDPSEEKSENIELRAGECEVGFRANYQSRIQTCGR